MSVRRGMRGRSIRWWLLLLWMIDMTNALLSGKDDESGGNRVAGR